MLPGETEGARSFVATASSGCVAPALVAKSNGAAFAWTHDAYRFAVVGGALDRRDLMAKNLLDLTFRLPANRVIPSSRAS